MNPGTTISIGGKSYELSPAFLSHVLATAVEGGSTYWAAVSSTTDGDVAGADDALDFDLSDYTEDEAEVGAEELSYTSASFNPLDDPHSGGTLDLQAIADAIERIAGGEAEVPPAVREIIVHAVQDDDAADIDAEVADCIVQIALFDEIVYG